MKHPRAIDLFLCFLRSYLVVGAYNPRGLQNVGFMFALEPVLAVIYGPGQELAEARKRYAANYNSHPFFTPMLLGVFIHMELAIAGGGLQKSVLENLKATTANTLSAIGDSFFSGSLLVSWALACCCLILAGYPSAAMGVTLTAFVLLQLFKLGGFMLGLRKGMAVLFFLRRLDLINLGDLVKYANAFLLAGFFWLAVGHAAVPVFAGTGVYLAVAAWAVGRVHASRILIALALLAITVGLHITGFFGVIPNFWTTP